MGMVAGVWDTGIYMMLGYEHWVMDIEIWMLEHRCLVKAYLNRKSKGHEFVIELSILKLRRVAKQLVVLQLFFLSRITSVIFPAQTEPIDLRSHRDP